MWAEKNIGAYERSVGGEHGTDVPIRVDRSLLGRRDIATGQVVGVQDFATVSRCESGTPQPRAASLASGLGITSPPVQAGTGGFAYGLVARGEAQTYFDLPDSAAAFDRHIWAHAAGTLLVDEAGGLVTDTVGNPLDFSTCRDGPELPSHVVGVIATNKDVHQEVLRGILSVQAS
jgi:3'-phosphoadenosine 5'-phosphosulfate (PAPS) 3'-phosphatase